MTKTDTKAGVTISDLATKHDCDRATIRRHLNAIGLKPVAQRGDVKYYDPTLANEAITVALSSGKKAVSKELREAKLREEIKRLQLANEEKTRTLIPRREHEHEIREMASEVQKRMYALPPRAPELAGLPTADIEGKLIAWIDEVVGELASAAKQIAPDVCPLCQKGANAQRVHKCNAVA